MEDAVDFQADCYRRDLDLHLNIKDDGKVDQKRDMLAARRRYAAFELEIADGEDA